MIFRERSFATLVADDPLLYVDAGARGDLEGGWRDYPKDCLAVLAFEPDPEAIVDWEHNLQNRYLERSALWSAETALDVHMGKVPSTSSVWPPNMAYLARFADRHVDPRITQAKVRVPAQPLDAVVARRGLRPDFLKIDTQGAELQILEGADQVLEKSAFGAVVETWTVPIHKGQGLTHEIMSLMYSKGFSVFQAQVAAAWSRNIDGVDKLATQRQTVGLDLLFFKDPQEISERFVSSAYTAKFASVAQMYGHYDLALEVLNLGLAHTKEEDASVVASLCELIRRQGAKTERSSGPRSARSRIGQIFKRLTRALSNDERKQEVTKLHY